MGAYISHISIHYSTADGGVAVTVRGICLNTSQNPIDSLTKTNSDTAKNGT